QVNDEPNVRGAHRLIEEGMNVSSQNTWPSLKYDIRAINQLGSRFLGPGFYYKTFIKPDFLRPMYQKVLRGFVHGGVVAENPPKEIYEKRYAHADVLVAGGGPAGMAAALAAAEMGASVMLVEEEHQLGGHLRWSDGSLARQLRSQVKSTANIRVFTDATVAARYDDNWITVVQRTPKPACTSALSKPVPAAWWLPPDSLNAPMRSRATICPGSCCLQQPVGTSTYILCDLVTAQ